MPEEGNVEEVRAAEVGGPQVLAVTDGLPAWQPFGAAWGKILAQQSGGELAWAEQPGKGEGGLPVQLRGREKMAAEQQVEGERLALLGTEGTRGKPAIGS